MTKKIIILGTAHPYRGGISSFNHRMSEELIRAGYDVSIFNFSLQYPNFLFPGKTQYSDDDPPINLNIERIVNSVNPLNWWRVIRRIKKLCPDIIITRFWIPFIGLSLGSILKGIRGREIRKIAIVDNIIPHEKRIGDWQLAQYFVNNCDEFIVMSRQVENDLRLFNKTKTVKYLPHPLYDNYGKSISKLKAKRNLGLDENTNYILFFGLIRAYKGLDLLLQSVDSQQFNRLNIKLIVAGEFYDAKKKYEEIVEKKRSHDVVIMHDYFIPSEQVKNYFCAADLVVQTYRSATQSGISQIAYHFDKPMIVTNVGGLPEIVSDGVTGFVVDRDPAAIANAINKFYSQNLEESFVKGVKEKKKEFSWNSFVSGVLA